jgi:hypothetical protein
VKTPLAGPLNLESEQCDEKKAREPESWPVFQGQRLLLVTKSYREEQCHSGSRTPTTWANHRASVRSVSRARDDKRCFSGVSAVLAVHGRMQNKLNNFKFI